MRKVKRGPGRPASAKPKSAMSIYLLTSLKAKLSRAAKKNGHSLSEEVSQRLTASMNS
jgi:hypothetical protein